MKTCPFCKKEIKKEATYCPHCRTTIAESFNGPKTQRATQYVPKKSWKMPALPKIPHIRVGASMSYIVFLLLIAGSVMYTSVTAPELPPPVAVSATSPSIPVVHYDPVVPEVSLPVIHRDPVIPEVSLPTGTILKKCSACNGDGELTIKNGTSHATVAKLLRGTGTSATSVLSVYIGANDEYTMKGIPDGTYWLLFAQGIGWDATTHSFDHYQSAQKFDDTFSFETTATKYSTWEVTLNPVLGGTATTGGVNDELFAKY